MNTPLKNWSHKGFNKNPVEFAGEIKCSPLEGPENLKDSGKVYMVITSVQVRRPIPSLKELSKYPDFTQKIIIENQDSVQNTAIIHSFYSKEMMERWLVEQGSNFGPYKIVVGEINPYVIGLIG